VDVAALNPELTEADRQIVDNWLTEFEQTWSPELLSHRVADLPGGESALRRPALISMVRIDMRRTWQPSGQKVVEKYVKQFPELRGAGGVPLELLQEELELRKSSGLPSSILQYLFRFPAQAKEIRQWAETAAATGSGSGAAPSTPLPTPAAVRFVPSVADSLSRTAPSNIGATSSRSAASSSASPATKSTPEEDPSRRTHANAAAPTVTNSTPLAPPTASTKPTHAVAEDPSRRTQTNASAPTLVNPHPWRQPRCPRQSRHPALAKTRAGARRRMPPRRLCRSPR